MSGSITLVRVSPETSAVRRVRSMALAGGVCLIGSSPECHITICAAGVASPVHVVVTVLGEECAMLENRGGADDAPVCLGSGKVVKKKAVLRSGDMFTLAGKTFLYEYGAGAPGGGAAEEPPDKRPRAAPDKKGVGLFMKSLSEIVESRERLFQGHTFIFDPSKISFDIRLCFSYPPPLSHRCIICHLQSP